MYKQIDGVAMGSPLGPTLANFFLGHFEKLLFYGSDFEPSLYIRYVDDIFCVFKDEASKLQFFERLNNLHTNLKFTVENATDKLPFLDVDVSIKDGNLETSVFRKGTHTGVFMNFAAMAPQKWKFGLIFCMLHRAYAIC